MNEEQYPMTLESVVEILQIHVDQIGQLREDLELLRKEIRRINAELAKIKMSR